MTDATVVTRPWDRWHCSEELDPDEPCELRWLALGVLCLALVMVVAGVSSLIVALPTLVRDLDATATELTGAVALFDQGSRRGADPGAGVIRLLG